MSSLKISSNQPGGDRSQFLSRFRRGAPEFAREDNLSHVTNRLVPRANPFRGRGMIFGGCLSIRLDGRGQRIFLFEIDRRLWCR